MKIAPRDDKMTNDNDLQTPAYVSLQTFFSLVKRFSDATLPPQIDKSVLSTMSYGTQSQMKTSMRFLGLTTSGGEVTEELRRLVEAYGTTAWKAAWGNTVTDAYRKIVEGIDLQNGTHQQLESAFRNAGATGSINAKAVRFYLGALDEAEVSYSPYFKGRKRTESGKTAGNSGTKRVKKKKRVTRKPPTPDKPEEPTPQGWKRFDLPLPGHELPARLDLPEKLSPHEWGIVRAYIEAYYEVRWDEEVPA